jgi:hypothetical protein
VHGVRIERAKSYKSKNRWKTWCKTDFATRSPSSFASPLEKVKRDAYRIDVGRWKKVRAKFWNLFGFPVLGAVQWDWPAQDR